MKQDVISSIRSLRQSTDIDEALRDINNSYFIIATPPDSHHQISLKVLSHKKHILIAKPLALNSKDAEGINDLALKHGVVAMIDHTFMFHPAVSAQIAETKAGAIGTPKTFYADWLSRGKIQDGIDVIWDLAPHPLSILLEFWEFPIDVSCKALDTIGGITTEASLFLTEKHTGNSAIIHVSWMDSDKSRMFKIRGSHHTIIFDDTQEISSKLRIKGGKTHGHPLLNEGYYEPIYQLDYPTEKTIMLGREEPIKNELRSFIAMAQRSNSVNADPMINEVRKGVACVKLIEAAERSIALDKVVHER
jgi:predicted dehydrogenase